MKSSLFIFSLLLSIFQCESEPPTCTDSLIKAISKEPVRNPPAELWEYEIDGKKYYYVTSYCCDFFSDLYDSTCNLVCHPDGGITGDGDGRCGELKSKLVNGKLIWKDPRE